MSAPLRGIKPWVRKAAIRVIKRAPPPTIKHWNVLAGDTVRVMAGGGKGVTGVVKKVIRDQNRVIVAGANFVKRHVRPSASGPGGVVSVESPVHVSNVALIDPVSGKPSRVGIKFTPEGDRVRVAKRSGAIVPRPESLATARRARRPVEPGPRDTPAELVAAVTYHPPASLLPYLAPAGPQSLFRVRGGENAAEPALPRKLRFVRMRAHHRKALRGRWERGLAEARVAADTEAALRALGAGKGAVGGKAGGGGSGGGDSGGTSSSTQQQAELR